MEGSFFGKVRVGDSGTYGFPNAARRRLQGWAAVPAYLARLERNQQVHCGPSSGVELTAGGLGWSPAQFAPDIPRNLAGWDSEGPTAIRIAVRRYRTDVNDVAALSEHAVFYARCSVFEDLAYGIESGRDKYVDKCLAAMELLFPA